MILRGIEFNMNWEQGEGHQRRDSHPRDAGVYCEIYWPVRGIRIGVSSNIWSRHGGHLKWMRDLKAGKVTRKGPLAAHVKDWGNIGLEVFVLSVAAGLTDKQVREDCELELHTWAERQSNWKNFNGHPRRPSNYGIPVCDERQAAKDLGVTLKWSF